MSGRVSDNASLVRDILKRNSTLTFADLKSLVGKLKGEKSFGDTRKLLQHAKQRPNLKDHSDWIAQQLALCTYKDQDLHVDLKFDSAMSITKVYPPPRHQGNSPILGDIIISSLSGFVGFGWENFSQPVSSLEV